MLKMQKLKQWQVPEELRGALNEILELLGKKVREDAVVLAQFIIESEEYDQTLAFLRRNYENVLVDGGKTAIYVVPIDHYHDHLSAKEMFNRGNWRKLVTDYILEVLGFEDIDKYLKEDIVKDLVKQVVLLKYFIVAEKRKDAWSEFQRLMYGSVSSASEVVLYRAGNEVVLHEEETA